jgi:pyruvate kinase
MTIRNPLAYLRRQEWRHEGTWLVVIINALANDKIIDTIQVRQIE